MIGELVHENTRERPREQARRKSRIARASRKWRYQESRTESRVHAGLRQVTGNDDRRQKSQKAREWLWLPQYNARAVKNTAVFGIILAATSLTTANLLTCLKENTTCVLASWNGTWFESMGLTCRSTLYHKMKEALKTIREEKRSTPILARCWRRFIRRRDKIQGMGPRLRTI